jgi:hypothetical protein
MRPCAATAASFQPGDGSMREAEGAPLVPALAPGANTGSMPTVAAAGTSLGASSSTSAHGEAMLARLRSEGHARLAVQQQLLDVQAASLESVLRADAMALEVEGLRQERCVRACVRACVLPSSPPPSPTPAATQRAWWGRDHARAAIKPPPTRVQCCVRVRSELLHERSERMGATLHMLEARNQRLSGEAASLEDRMAVLASARDTLLGERDALAGQVDASKQVRARRSHACASIYITWTAQALRAPWVVGQGQ